MKKIYILATVFLALFTSCEDLLDKGPLDQIDSNAFWHKTSDLENYAVQFYAQLPGFEISNHRTGPFGDDAFNGSDDEILILPNTTLDGARPVVNAAGGSNWNWSMLRSINLFFDSCNKCQDDFASWAPFLGEVHFFRAWFYFKKVQDYGDVPWYGSALAMDSEELYKARDPRTQVVDSILHDLDLAIEYLKPLKSADGGNNRLSKEAALIFKSRVALFEGTWQKYHAGTPFGTQGADPKKYLRIAIDACKELMSGKYSVGLYGNSAEEYGKMFGADNMASNREVILWRKYDKALDLSHDLQMYTTSRTNDRSVTFEFVQSFLSKEGDILNYNEIVKEKKGSAFLNYLADNSDPRLSQIIWIPGDVMWNNNNGYKEFDKPHIGQTNEYGNYTGFQVKKGVNPMAAGAGGTFVSHDSQTGYIIFRYAEALLNYAEAACELGEPVDYDKSINLLRKRVGMPNFKVQHDSNAPLFADFGYPVTDELFEIRRERRVELGIEGFRCQDYRRWRAHNLFKNKRPKGYVLDESEYTAGTKFPPKDANGLLDPFAKSLPNGYTFDEGRDYLMCIPINEITLNPEIKQNPGW